MDYKEGITKSDNHAMSGASESVEEEDVKAVPSSPKLECENIDNIKPLRCMRYED